MIIIAATKEIEGQKFGRLTTIAYLYSKEIGTCGKSVRMYLCKCDCGNTKIVSRDALTNGKVKSCGCLAKENFKTLSENPIHVTHGMSKTRLYQCWSKMKRRCSHEPNWVKKGIKVCDEWKKFEPFRDWALSNGYSDELTLDRVDPYGNYEPANCKWSTYIEQANNKTNNHRVTIAGVSHTISEWSRISGVPAPTIAKRIEHGHPELSWLTPVGENYFTDYNERKSYITRLTINGETKKLSEWSKISGVNRQTIATRIARGWPEEEWLLPVGKMYHGNRSANLQNESRFNGTGALHITDNIVSDFYRSDSEKRKVGIGRFKTADSAAQAYRASVARQKYPIRVSRKNGCVYLEKIAHAKTT